MGSGFSRKKKEAKLMQDQLSKMQTQMSKMEVTGTAGNGLVTLVLTGKGVLKSIKIQPDCVDKEDIDGLEMLIKSAHADAQKKITEQTASSSTPSNQWLNLL
jgi:DNA-binding YbaB/EbfC family protein